ncbi:MAG: D-tyrosyl-tRNA(Tyr) deacylase [Gemmatimonas sp. SG8_17]|nr:MAG: D-tyrosyl-tRNA(Tyr) deacylase [Gemmatimonas sp. SG8_17]
MKVVLQRVSRASVRVGRRAVAAINHGFLVLVGFTNEDADAQLQWMADKIVGIRLFADEEGKMNRDIREVGGAILVVSQFTLYADARKGRRPSFIGAAPPEQATVKYQRFVQELAARGVQVATGEFGATMDVELVNDGPVTLILER